MKLATIAALLFALVGCGTHQARPPYPSTLPAGFGGTTKAEERAAFTAFGWAKTPGAEFPRVNPSR